MHILAKIVLKLDYLAKIIITTVQTMLNMLNSEYMLFLVLISIQWMITLYN